MIRSGAGRARTLGIVRRRLANAPAPAGRNGGADGLAAGVYAGLADLADRYGDALGAGRDLTRYERRIFSQNGEDGVLAEIVRRVGATEHWFVEFGIGGGHQGNCVLLADVFGWSGLFIECDPPSFDQLETKYATNARVRTTRSFVRPDNIEALFADAGVPSEPDIVSIDVDGNDWWIWRALTSYRPRIVVVEYNGNLDPTSELVKPYDPEAEWDGTSWFGSSLGAYCRLGADKGYRLVHTDLRGVNAFFVRDDLAGPFDGIDPPRRRANYDLRGGRMPGDPALRRWVDLADGEPDPV